MKLLVSPINTEEAVSACNGGADIIDVKNPKEGSLGANFPWVIKEVKDSIDSKKPISATIGDFNYKPGTASLAAYGAASSGAEYIKVGLYDIQTEEQAYDMLENITNSVKNTFVIRPSIKIRFIFFIISSLNSSLSFRASLYFLLFPLFFALVILEFVFSICFNKSKYCLLILFSPFF